MVMTYSHANVLRKVKVNGQSVPKIEWKQTDGQMDKGDCITSLANVVGKSVDVVVILSFKRVKMGVLNLVNKLITTSAT